MAPRGGVSIFDPPPFQTTRFRTQRIFLPL